MHINLVGLTGGTPFYVIFHVLLQLGPPISPCDEVFSLHNAWVSSCWWVVEFSYDFPSFIGVSRDHQLSFLVPFPSKLLESMGIGPFAYRRHLLIILRLCNG